MSWHLQTLAKYGFVEEAGGGKGRSRPWRIVTEGTRINAVSDEPGRGGRRRRPGAAGARARRCPDAEVAVHAARLLDGVAGGLVPQQHVTYLTPGELAALAEEVVELFLRHTDRVKKRNRPEGALPVRLTAFGNPLPPTAAGN